MRNEKTVEAIIRKYRKSPYRRHYNVIIGTLLWVLGEASSPKQGAIQEYNERLKQESKETQGGR